jgi:hypothetical protein
LLRKQADREDGEDFPLKKTSPFYIFFNFPRKIFTAKFVVIGFKRGKSPALGEKQAAAMLGFGKSREAGASAYLTYIKQPPISQSRARKTPFR